MVIPAGVGAAVRAQKKPPKTALRKSCAHLFANLSPWVKLSQGIKTGFKMKVSFSPLNTFAFCFWELEHFEDYRADSPKLAVGRQKNVLLNRKNISPPGFPDFEAGAASASLNRAPNASRLSWNWWTRFQHKELTCLQFVNRQVPGYLMYLNTDDWADNRCPKIFQL